MGDLDFSGLSAWLTWGWTILKSVLTWLATLISIGGGVYAWRQAKSAKESATQAEEVRKDILSKRDTNELSTLSAMLAKAIQTMDKFGPGSKPDLLGYSPNNDSTSVREVTSCIALHMAMLRTIFEQKIDEIHSNLTEHLSEFGEADSDREWILAGRKIYLQLTEFSGILKGEMNKKLYA